MADPERQPGASLGLALYWQVGLAYGLDGCGWGITEAARGGLAHRVELQGGRATWAYTSCLTVGKCRRKDQTVPIYVLAEIYGCSLCSRLAKYNPVRRRYSRL